MSSPFLNNLFNFNTTQTRLIACGFWNTSHNTSKHNLWCSLWDCTGWSCVGLKSGLKLFQLSWNQLSKYIYSEWDPWSANIPGLMVHGKQKTQVLFVCCDKWSPLNPNGQDSPSTCSAPTQHQVNCGGGQVWSSNYVADLGRPRII